MTPEGGLVVTGVWLPQQERSAPLAKFQMKQTLFPELGKPIFHIPFPSHTDWVKVGHSTWVKIVGAHVMQMCGQWNVEPSVEKTHPSTGQGSQFRKGREPIQEQWSWDRTVHSGLPWTAPV